MSNWLGTIFGFIGGITVALVGVYADVLRELIEPGQFLEGHYTCKGGCQIPDGTAEIRFVDQKIIAKNESANDPPADASYDSISGTVFVPDWRTHGEVNRNGGYIVWFTDGKPNGTTWVRKKPRE
jgi:hypothetical protein